MPPKSSPPNPAHPAGATALPADFEEQVRQQYSQLDESDAGFPAYLAAQTREFHRQQALIANPALRYAPSPRGITPCGNGDLEQDIAASTEWQGAFGTRGAMVSGAYPFANFTAGIYPGTGIADYASHQSWVQSAADPIVPILTAAPGSTHAVRIGNSAPGKGCELLSKTFIVSAAQPTLSFWYAVVLQDSGHAAQVQPFFWVRVTDASGNIVPGAFTFDGVTDRLVAHDSPFLQHKVEGDSVLRYRDWSCAQINLSSQIGRQVTIEFITADCLAGGHYGYAYIDRFCGNCAGSPTGNFSYNCEASSHCGPGEICFAYELPHVIDATNGATIIGEVAITLDIYQSGVKVSTLASGMLTAGRGICFTIDPAHLPGVNPAYGGFDFQATAVFSLGTTPLGQMVVGTSREGVAAGRNNDYLLRCQSCELLDREQAALLSRFCETRQNHLPKLHCHCPPGPVGDCGCSSTLPAGDGHHTAAAASSENGCDCEGRCDCKAITWPEIKPCITVAWGDSACDCMETTDVEILCVSVCNCYSNLSFSDLVIHQIRVTDMNGYPVPRLPDGTPSVQVVPSGPIHFGDVGPCHGADQPTCVKRELVLRMRGARAGDLKLSFEGVCFDVTHHVQDEQCFKLSLCQD